MTLQWRDLPEETKELYRASILTLALLYELRRSGVTAINHQALDPVLERLEEALAPFRETWQDAQYAEDVFWAFVETLDFEGENE